jgi:hypothetical protein
LNPAGLAAVTARDGAGIPKEVQIMARASKSSAATRRALPIRKSSKSSKPTGTRKRVRVARMAAKPIAIERRTTAAPKRQSKKAAILSLLQQPDGAAIADLTAATGWQVHSVRAALTGLRKEGKEVLRVKNATGVTHYRLAS